MTRLAAMFVTSLLLSSVAWAGTDVAVSSFSKLSANSGADVKLIYGPAQRVTVIRGDLKKARIQVKDGQTLEIAGCTGWCWGSNNLEVEVVTPRVESVVASSGADVRASGNFPKQPYLYVQAHSGGEADVTAVPAETVDAIAHSGGSASVHALWTLNAKAHSGGDVHYKGSPPRLNSQTSSGGDVSSD